MCTCCLLATCKKNSFVFLSYKRRYEIILLPTFLNVFMIKGKKSVQLGTVEHVSKKWLLHTAACLLKEKIFFSELD